MHLLKIRTDSTKSVKFVLPGFHISSRALSSAFINASYASRCATPGSGCWVGAERYGMESPVHTGEQAGSHAITARLAAGRAGDLHPLRREHLHESRVGRREGRSGDLQSGEAGCHAMGAHGT